MWLLLYAYCFIRIGIQTPAISLLLLTSHASLNSRLHVQSLFQTNSACFVVASSFFVAGWHPGQVNNRLQHGAVGLGEWGHALACRLRGWGWLGMVGVAVVVAAMVIAVFLATQHSHK